MASMEECFSIQCEGVSESTTVTVFYTEDENKICMISQEPINQSCLDFCPDATLRQQFDRYNGIRLSCGHEFSAICLLWSWILNTMICPCCRDGNANFSACLSNVHLQYRQVLRERKDALEASERDEQIQSDADLGEAMVLEVQLAEPVVMVALYFYGDDCIHNIVLQLHRHGAGADQDNARFYLQRSDLRTISRSICRHHTTGFAFVIFSQNATGMSCIMRSPRIDVSPNSVVSDVASDVTNDAFVATLVPTDSQALETVVSMRTVGVLDRLMSLLSPEFDLQTNEVETTENNSVSVSQLRGVEYNRQVQESSASGYTTNLCVRTVPMLGNVQVEFRSSAQDPHMLGFLCVTWIVPLQSLQAIFLPTMFTVVQYNM
jgi:hypothetical protein